MGESGEIRFEDGEPAAEGSLARADDLDRDWDALELADEDTVLDVAAEWSIDPTTLDGDLDLPPEGLLGYLPAGTSSREPSSAASTPENS